MRFRFQYRRYRLPFRAVVRTAHGLWSEREGVIVRLENEDRDTGLGEAAPIPWFGTETVAEVEEACRSLGEWVEAETLQSVPGHLRCLRNAIAAGLVELSRTADRKAEPQRSGAETADSAPPSVRI